MGLKDDKDRASVLAKVDELMAKMQNPELDFNQEQAASELQTTIAALAVDPQVLPKIYLEAVEKTPLVISLIPEEQRDIEICVAALKKQLNIGHYIPNELQAHPRILAEAVRHDPEMLMSRGFPAELKTKELYLIAIEKDYRYVAIVPDDLIDQEEFKSAIKKTQNAIENYKLNDEGNTFLRFVPKKYRTTELALSAISHNWRELNDDGFDEELFNNETVTNDQRFKKAKAEYIKALVEKRIDWYTVPRKMLTFDDRIELIDKCRENASQIFSITPVEQRDLKLCLSVVNANKASAEAVKEYISYKNYQIFHEHISQSISDYKTTTALQSENEYDQLAMAILKKEYGQVELSDRDVCVEAVTKKRSNFEFVPRRYRDFTVCKMALGDGYNSDVLRMIVEDIKAGTSILTLDQRREIFVSAIKESRPNIGIVPVEFRDFFLCKKAVEADYDGEIFSLIVNDIKERKSILNPDQQREIFVAAVNSRTSNFWKIPSEYLDLSLCKALVEADFDGAILSFIVKDIKEGAILKNRAQQREVFVAAVKKNSSNFSKVPHEFRDLLLCKAAIEADHGSEVLSLIVKDLKDLKDLKEPKNKESTSVLKLGEARGLFWFAVKKDKSNFEKLPEEYRDFLCKAVFEDNYSEEIFGLVIKDIKEATLLLNSDLRQDLFLSFVKRKASNFSLVPSEFRDYSLCKEAVADSNNAQILKIITDDYTGSISPLSKNQYRQVCFEAILQNANAIDSVDEKIRKEILLEAVKVNSLLLPRVTELKEAGDLSEEKYRALCVEVAENNPMAMEYLDNDLRKYVIEKISIEKILTTNFASRNFFPNEEKYTQAIMQYLASVEHVVIVENGHFERDKEISDAYRVYATAPQRAGKTVLIYSSEASVQVAEVVAAQTKNPKKINLILLGHANRECKQLGGLQIPQMVDLLKKHESIGRLVLLGCRTAGVKRLSQESQMFQGFSRAPQIPSHSHVGVLLKSSMPGPEEYSKFFAKMPRNIDGLFVLVKNPDNQTNFDLVYIKKNVEKSPEFIVQQYSLTNEAAVELARKMTGGKEKFNFPTKKDVNPTYYRGGKGTEILNQDEVEYFNEAIDSSRYSKENPRYKEMKKTYPFLASATLTKEEEAKLLPSLLEKVVKAVNGDSDITRHVVIKGYMKSLHVDTKERQMKATNVNPYTSSYIHSKIPFFQQPKENIDRSKLKSEWDEDVKKFEAERAAAKDVVNEANQESRLKSVKVVTTPQKTGP